MPRKKPEELDSAPAPAAAPEAPSVSYTRDMTVERGALPADADMNGDGHISKREMEMHLEFKRKELEDQDAMRDAQRKMAWFSLGGMLLYPFAVVLASLAGLDQAQGTLGDMAPTYFVAVAGIVAAFFGAQAYSGKSK
jgi:hypothetical protein